jgi:hypothetical protein
MNFMKDELIRQEQIMTGRVEYLRAIASYGITSADVEFDGCGDDGQIGAEGRT